MLWLDMIICSPSVLHIICHIYSRCLDFTDILALEVDVHHMPPNFLRFNLRASICQTFPGGMPLDPLAFIQLHIQSPTIKSTKLQPCASNQGT